MPYVSYQDPAQQAEQAQQLGEAAAAAPVSPGEAVTGLALVALRCDQAWGEAKRQAPVPTHTEGPVLPGS